MAAPHPLKHALTFDVDAVSAQVCSGACWRPVFLTAVLETTLEHVLECAVTEARAAEARGQKLREADANEADWRSGRVPSAIGLGCS